VLVLLICQASDGEAAERVAAATVKYGVGALGRSFTLAYRVGHLPYCP
jgi:hypothetical protein